jgi:virginiamycin B lyase
MPNVRKLLFATAGSVLVMVALAAQRSDVSESGVILVGMVTSASGETLGGATVSARRSGSTITTSVFTDPEGHYYFPPMAAGQYSVRAQVIGWEKAERVFELKGVVQERDLVLDPTTDVFTQLPGDQMIAALPEDTPAHRRMKAVFINVCTECHSASMALSNRFDAHGWDAVVTAMSRLETTARFRDRPSPVISQFQDDLVAYLTEMRGPGPSPIRVETSPRPIGEASLPVVYEYDLPAEVGGGHVLNNGGDWSLGPPAASGGGFGIHDATVDFYDNVWFTYNDRESIARSIGKVDVKTGRVTDFKYARPDGLAATTHGIFVGHDGMIWFNVNLRDPDVPDSARLGRIDPTTDVFDVFTPPVGMNAMTIHVAEDGEGQIWGDSSTGAVRFNPATREWRAFESLTLPGFTYGAAGDRNGDGWWAQFGIDVVGHADVETGAVTEITLPPSTHGFLQAGDLSNEDRKALSRQRPRRLAADVNGDDVWVPNFSGNNLMRINIKTMKTTFYPAPRVGMNPYMAAVDGSHNVWVSFLGGDQVGKFDPTTETWMLYSWPSRGTALRNLGLVDHDGVVQVIGAYFNAARVGRMVMRTERDVQALRARAQ